MNCPALSMGGPSAIADALRSVDCMSGQATAAAFSRIFGDDGLLTGALTIGLTLYVALFAIRLLAGRGSIGLSALTPRMMALGLALTFATSWIAYSQLVWTLLAAGPDWIASAILGIDGSASHAFAGRLDSLFRAVADAAEEARQAGGDQKGTAAADLLSYAALLLLLGTVGVLVTSRIALAALLAVGPIFVMLALFSGTRGLFEGWLKTAILFALVPLFTVLIGVGAVAVLAPVIDGLAGGAVDMEQATTVFVAAVIHCALMAMSLKLVSALTSGWRLPIGAPEPQSADPAASVVLPATAMTVAAAPNGRIEPFHAAGRDERVRSVVAAVAAPHAQGWSNGGDRIVHLPGVSAVSPRSLPAVPAAATAGRARDIAHGVRGSRSAHSIQETLA